MIQSSCIVVKAFGTIKNINSLFRNLDEQKVIYAKARINYEAYEGVIVKLTEAALHDHGSSGGINSLGIDIWNQPYYEKSSSSKSNRSSSTQESFKDLLKNRDLFCRVHGKTCKNAKVAGHIIPINDDLHSNNDKMHSILNSSTNGIYWCQIMEELYHKYVFCIDAITGQLYCTPEFPYDYAQIDNLLNQIIKFKDSYQFDLADTVELSRINVVIYHDKYFIRNRIKLYEEYQLNKDKICDICGSNNINNVQQHKNDTQCNKLPIKKKYYPTSICKCQLCQDRYDYHYNLDQFKNLKNQFEQKCIEYKWQMNGTPSQLLLYLQKEKQQIQAKMQQQTQQEQQNQKMELYLQDEEKQCSQLQLHVQSLYDMLQQQQQQLLQQQQQYIEKIYSALKEQKQILEVRQPKLQALQQQFKQAQSQLQQQQLQLQTKLQQVQTLVPFLQDMDKYFNTTSGIEAKLRSINLSLNIEDNKIFSFWYDNYNKK